MGRITEYLTLQKAKKIKNKLDSLLNKHFLECKIQYKGERFEEWQMTINNKYNHLYPDLTPSQMSEIIEEFITICKRYYISFTISRHGENRVYISIDIKK